MAQRTVCLCDGRYIGIETIYTVVDGKQINKEKELAELRKKSQAKLLFCPCGCGANLTLVAGDQNLREQHFRLKRGDGEKECHALIEGRESIEAKIALKCWLDEKLQTEDIESRVPICKVDDSERKYEYTFYSKSNKIALSYSDDRRNLSDEKMDIITGNSQGIHVIFVVNESNAPVRDQFPENLIKIQNRQGYCLFVRTMERDYTKAVMKASFYARDIRGLWKEVEIVKGGLCEFDLDHDGNVSYRGLLLSELCDKVKADFEERLAAQKVAEEKAEQERVREAEERKERERRRAEKLKQQIAEREALVLQQKKEEEAKRVRLEEERRREERNWIEYLKKQKAEKEAKKAREEEQKKIEKATFLEQLPVLMNQQEKMVTDPNGERYLKCKCCGHIGVKKDFCLYGGGNEINLGVCYECSRNGNMEANQAEELRKRQANQKEKLNICQMCGAPMEKAWGYRGYYWRCSQYPNCRYTRSIRKDEI